VVVLVVVLPRSRGKRLSIDVVVALAQKAIDACPLGPLVGNEMSLTLWPDTSFLLTTFFHLNFASRSSKKKWSK
jgi:hypothetical protein